MDKHQIIGVPRGPNRNLGAAQKGRPAGQGSGPRVRTTAVTAPVSTGQQAPVEAETKAERPALRVTADEVAGAVGKVTDTCVDIGVPEPSGEKLVLQLDARAPQVASLLGEALTHLPAVSTLSGVTADQETKVVGQFDAMLSFYGESVQFGAAVSDSRAVVAVCQRNERAHIKLTIQAALKAGTLSPNEAGPLSAALDQLIAQEDKIKQAPVDRRAETERKNLNHQAVLAEMGDHYELLQTIIDTQNGVDVSDERIADALDRLQQMKAGNGTSQTAGSAASQTVRRQARR